MDPDMTRDTVFQQIVWFENKIANIKYVKQVDIFRESNQSDICTDAHAQPIGLQAVTG